MYSPKFMFFLFFAYTSSIFFIIRSIGFTTVFSLFFLQMDKFRSECTNVIEDAMKYLEVLQGTEYEELINDVRISLSNGFEELATFVEAEKLAKKEGGVKVVMIEGHRVKVCYMTAYCSGDGRNAVGGVGVAWGEKIQFNMGTKVQTNVVNKRNAEIWGMTVACCVAEARKYSRIMIMTEEITYTAKILRDLESGRMDNFEDCKVLVEMFKKYSGKVKIMLPDDVLWAEYKSSQENVIKESKKKAKDALKNAKTEMKTWGKN